MKIGKILAVAAVATVFVYGRKTRVWSFRPWR